MSDSGSDGQPDEPPELFRPRPGDEIVEPLFGALRGEADPAEEVELVPRTGWRAMIWWRVRLLFRRRGERRG